MQKLIQRLVFIAAVFNTLKNSRLGRGVFRFILFCSLLAVVYLLSGCKVQFSWDHADPESVAAYGVTTNGSKFFTVDQSITLDLDYDLKAYPCVSVIAYSSDLLASDPTTLCLEDYISEHN